MMAVTDTASIPSSFRSNRRKIEPISHEIALRLLLAAESQQSYPPLIREELPAIISHWLQGLHGQQLLPGFVGKDAVTRWMGILASWVRAQVRPPTEMPEVPPTGIAEIDYGDIPFPSRTRTSFKFIDLFAGIGGFRLALQRLGGKCAFSSEWDPHAKQTYYSNYGEVPFGNIRNFTNEAVTDEALDAAIPDHDILAGGFPCQPFSHAGVSARTSLGKSHGFSCEIQGTLFFDMMRIARVKRPRALFLENVKNLRGHDGGRTFQRIRDTIEKDLGYTFNAAVIDSSPLVPQRRKRCYIVCFRDADWFEMPEITGDPLPLSMVLEPAPSSDYTISDRMWQGHINRTKRNLARGVGFTAYETDISKPANTLVARYYKDGKECLIPQQGANPRMLTPRECARLQGYPENFIPHPWTMQAYRQFGNSVAVPVIERIGAEILKSLGIRQA